MSRLCGSYIKSPKYFREQASLMQAGSSFCSRPYDIVRYLNEIVQITWMKSASGQSFGKTKQFWKTSKYFFFRKNGHTWAKRRHDIQPNDI
jgi:hypothetical protein